MAIVTRSRIAFPPPSDSMLGEVKVYGPDGALIRTISVAALRQRAPAVPAQHAPIMGPASDPYPSVSALRRQKASRNLTRRNKARART